MARHCRCFLIHQLRTQSSLKDVTTIVKTERADNRIWQQVALDDFKARQKRTKSLGVDRESVASPSFRTDLRLRPPTEMVGRIQTGPSEEQPDEAMSGFESCTGTQIIVQVGKRRPRRQGQDHLRGEGLQMGYQGYCIEMVTESGITAASLANAPTPQLQLRPDFDEDGIADAELDAAARADGRPGQEATRRRRLHILLLGREEVTAKAKDRNETEEMLERSIVTCNYCKQRIVF